MMLHLKDLIVFRHTRVMEKGKGSQCPSLGHGVTEGQGRYLRLQETLDPTENNLSSFQWSKTTGYLLATGRD